MDRSPPNPILRRSVVLALEPDDVCSTASTRATTTTPSTSRS